MAAVDVCTQAPAPVASKAAMPNDAKVNEFSCIACGEFFPTPAEHRAHWRSERHVYNTKRKQAGLKPISQEAWERKLRESRGNGGEQKGTAHLKAKKPSRKDSGADSQVPSSGVSVDASEAGPAEDVSTPRGCIFERKHFQSVDLCLAYMEKTYSFFIPDLEYCHDIPGLLSYLRFKASEGVCIHCNRRFPDLQSVRRHMIDKGHTQLASEAYTRRGRYDEEATNELREELEPFYDFSSSMREFADKITDPKQKAASILRFFDADKDQKLSQAEVASLWAAASDGQKLSEVQYEGACAMCEVDPKDGLDVEALAKLYADGFADVDQHFAMLQDLLIQRGKKLKTVEEDSDEDDEDAEEEDDGEEGEDSEDSEEDEVVECEDEDEFEEVMRVLGLQRVSITATGDLRLPNGSVAAHRDVSYIYKQRGTRLDQVAIAGSRRPAKRALLMLSNDAAAGSIKMAMSKRQEAREGKRIIAILRDQATKEMRLGVKQSKTLQKNKPMIRTGRGDCSNGR